MKNFKKCRIPCYSQNFSVSVTVIKLPVLVGSPVFCSVLFCSVLFLVCSVSVLILFWFVLFLFCSVLFLVCSISVLVLFLFCYDSVLFCSILFWFCSVLIVFCSDSVLFCSVLFWFCSVLFYSVLILYCSILFCSVSVLFWFWSVLFCSDSVARCFTAVKHLGLFDVSSHFTNGVKSSFLLFAYICGMRNYEPSNVCANGDKVCSVCLHHYMCLSVKDFEKIVSFWHRDVKLKSQACKIDVFFLSLEGGRTLF